MSADWRILLIGVVLMAAFVAFEARSSHLILRALGTPQPYRRCYLYSSTGFFFSNITPSATGGQPAQIYYMNRDGVPVAPWGHRYAAGHHRLPHRHHDLRCALPHPVPLPAPDAGGRGGLPAGRASPSSSR